jgi:hypothetical protein
MADDEECRESKCLQQKTIWGAEFGIGQSIWKLTKLLPLTSYDNFEDQGPYAQMVQSPLMT